MALDTYPLIVNLILEREDKILMIYREHTKVYQNAYALPAGKVEKGESLKQNIIREAKEEIGITLHPDDVTLAVTLWAKYNNEAGDPIEDVGFFFKASGYEGEVINAEPHKHGHVKWVALSNLPENTLPFTQVALEAYREGEEYVEYVDPI
jgi:8-oxo-dGTP pyrophosphatase MutT (NUDIX family)